MALEHGEIKTINWKLFGQQVSGTLVIALSFMFIAYLLHPIVQSAFNRIRAYRAWHNLENGQLVEVTHYALHDEILRGRKKWDAARMIAVMLLGFSVATWVLELNLKLYNIADGPVDLLDRPPPVMHRSGSSHDWNVLERELGKDSDGGGLYGNFNGGYDRGNATSRYNVSNETYSGTILTAWWSDNLTVAPANLYFKPDDNVTATVGTECNNNSSSGAVYKVDDKVDTDDKLWGNYTECSTGQELDDKDYCGQSPPPMIILKDLDGVAHTIVEEDSNYPSFLYSVWKNSTQPATPASSECSNSPVEVKFMFYIASKSRLVEAIITGIVNNITTGGGCMDLLQEYSFKGEDYDTGNGRASPFGEHPGKTSNVTKLDDVEPIERGVKINRYAGSACVLILFLSVIGVGGSFFLRSKIGMDVYDLRELIKAVTLPDQVGGDAPQSAMRIYVKLDAASRKLTVVISEDGVDEGLLRSALRLACCRRPPVQEIEHPTSSNDEPGNGDTGLPTGPVQMIQLEGTRMRFATQRAWTGNRGPRYVILSASPVSSLASTPTVGQHSTWSDVNQIARTQIAMAWLDSESMSTKLALSMDDRSAATVGSPISTQVNDTHGNYARNGLPDSSNGNTSPWESGRDVVNHEVAPARGDDDPGHTPDSLVGNGNNAVSRRRANSSIASTPRRPLAMPKRRDWAGDCGEVDSGHAGGFDSEGGGDVEEDRGSEGLGEKETVRSPPAGGVAVAGTETPHLPAGQLVARIDTVGPAEFHSLTHPEGGGDVEGGRGVGGVGGWGEETVRSPPAGVAVTGTETSPLPARQLVGGIDTVGPAEFHSLKHLESSPAPDHPSPDDPCDAF